MPSQATLPGRSPAPALTPQRLGRYTLLSQIAHGGMAEVYLATQDGPQGFQKIVVIKRILPHFAKEPEFVRMFLDEARVAALINHPNVVSIFELGEEPETGGYFMAMEYIEGRNLREIADLARRQRRPLTPRLTARLVADASAGLHYAHELTRPGTGEALRIVHRDISPENLLVTYGGLVKVVDFGIAKAAQSENLTKTGQVKGKLSYLSPEQLQGRKVDRRADLWSLGVTLYWLLTGEKPFKGDSEAHLMRAVLEATPPPLPRRARDSLAAFQPILDRALAKDPAQRYPTALALQNDLEKLLADADRPTTATAVAATMEKLFPNATDPERLRHRRILRNEPEAPSEEISLSLSAETPPVLSRVRAVGLAVATLLAIALAVGVARQALQRMAQDDAAATHRQPATP